MEIAEKFRVPLPKVVFRDDVEAGRYIDGRIELSPRLDPERMVRVAAHEMAHHIHSVYGVPCGSREAETFASMFEEAWYKMKKHGYSCQIMPCQICGFRLLMYGGRVECPRCGSIYRYESPGLGKAVGLALMSGIASYALTYAVMKEPTVSKRPEDAALTSAVASGIVGFLAGLIL